MSGFGQKEEEITQATHRRGREEGDSAHANQWIGLFTAKEMKACIDEIKDLHVYVAWFSTERTTFPQNGVGLINAVQI